MFQFLCKTFVHSKNGYAATLHNPSMVVPFSLIRYFSSDSDDPHSFTLSYLINTCGLSPKSALSACKRVKFESSEQPDSVLSSFEKFGFSKTQMSEMIRKYPKLLCCDPKKTISPKVEFFRSKGASTLDLVRIFTTNPWILRVSLENQLGRAFSILIDLSQSEHKAIEIIKRNPWVLHHNPEAFLVPNTNILRENGVPASNIWFLIRNHWICIIKNPVKFRKIVGEVKEIGFNPLNLHFVQAIIVMIGVGRSKRDGRVEVYKRWGWSDEDITMAFRKYPLYMAYSEEKIIKKMDFFINELGLKSSLIASRPVLLSYSLKKRLIPRGAVIQFLLSKGLVKLGSSIPYMFTCTDETFMKKYVNCQEEARQLINLYEEKLHETVCEGERKAIRKS